MIILVVCFNKMYRMNLRYFHGVGCFIDCLDVCILFGLSKINDCCLFFLFLLLQEASCFANFTARNGEEPRRKKLHISLPPDDLSDGRRVPICCHLIKHTGLEKSQAVRFLCTPLYQNILLLDHYVYCICI
jgi:hypothetical protein